MPQNASDPGQCYLLLIQQILQWSTGSQLDLLQVEDKYSKALRCSNISGKYGNLQIASWIIIWATSWQKVRPAKPQISLGIPPVWSVFAIGMKKASVISYQLCAQRRLWSDKADGQADLSFRWVHIHFVSFVIRWAHLILNWCWKKEDRNVSTSVNCLIKLINNKQIP